MKFFLVFLFISILDCLETEWKSEWFESARRANWKERQNQRAFFEALGRKLGLENHSDWGKVDIRTIEKHGGAGILRYYGRSMFKALKFLYPEKDWNIEWFSRYPPRFWNDKRNQREFLDKLAKELCIEEDRDWKGVTSSIVQENGGSALLNQYSGNLYRALQGAYPGLI